MAKKVNKNKGAKDFGMDNALSFLVTNDTSKTAKDKTKKITKTNKKNYTTVTVRIEDEKLEKVKALAFWNRRKLQDIYNIALQDYINQIDEETLTKAEKEYKNYLLEK